MVSQGKRKPLLYHSIVCGGDILRIWSLTDGLLKTGYSGILQAPAQFGGNPHKHWPLVSWLKSLPYEQEVAGSNAELPRISVARRPRCHLFRRGRLTMTVRQIVYLGGLILLPLPPLLCQQSPTRSQSGPPKRSSSSTLVVGFGPTVSNAEGKAAAEKLLQAMGGATKVNSIKTLHQTVSAVQDGRHIDIEQSIVYPDKQAEILKTPQGRVLLVVTPIDAFTVVGGQAQDLPPDQKTALESALKHDPINVLQHVNDANYVFVASGQEDVDGAHATVVDVEAAGIPTRWWIGADGKLLRERYYGEGGKMQTMVYSAWKNFEGLQYPTKYDTLNEAGQSGMTMTLTGMQINPVISQGLFQRPSP